MTTTTKAATAERILAIDLGKYKSVASDYRDRSGEVGFTAIDTTRFEVSKPLRKHWPGDRRSTRLW